MFTPSGWRERYHRVYRLEDLEEISRVDKLIRVAPIAQSAERLHGKEKVKGSIPFRGSIAA